MLIFFLLSLYSGLQMDYYLIEENVEAGPNTRLKRLTTLMAAPSIRLDAQRDQWSFELGLRGGYTGDGLLAYANTGNINTYEEERREFYFYDTYLTATRYADLGSARFGPQLGIGHRQDYGVLDFRSFNLHFGLAADFQLYDDFSIMVSTKMIPVLFGDYSDQPLSSSGTFALDADILYHLSKSTTLAMSYSFKRQHLRTDDENLRTMTEENGLSIGAIFTAGYQNR